MIKRFAVGVVFSVLTLGGVARAEAEESLPPPSDVPKFGSKNSLVISGDFLVAVQRYTAPPFPAQTSVTVRPTMDYFVLDHLSVGGGIGFGYMGNNLSGSQQTLSMGPRVGYEIDLSDRFSIWPTVGSSYSRTWTVFSGQAYPAYWALYAVASADVIGQIAPHFFMGFGPYVTGQLARSEGDAAGVGYGMMSTLGGWI